MEKEMYGIGKDDRDKRIGKRLRWLRKTHRFTQQQVADLLEINQSHYSKIEHGMRRLRWMSQVQKLCILYDCTEEFLLCEDDEYVPKSWSGVDGDTDLQIILKANETMRHLRILRMVESNMER